MPSQPAAPQTTRPAFLPAIIASAALLSALALLGTEWYLTVRFIVAILALIVGWFAMQAGQWWWSIVFAAVAIVWNPVYPLELSGPWWMAAHVGVAALFAVAGALIRVPRATA